MRIHSICMSSMMSHERSLLFSLLCSHSSSFLTPSLFLSSSTSPITLPDKNPTAVIPRNEDRGSLATTTPLTGYEPNVPDNFDDIEVTTSIFQSSSVCDNSTESPDPEIDDEHIKRWLHHCTGRSEKQMRASRKFITLMKKACYQVHSRS